MRILAFLLAGLSCLPAAPALAWGVEGHEIIAALAADRLTPAAVAQVRRLLGGPPKAAMIADANWADEIRDQRPDTGRWHFVNIPVDAAGYDARRDCRQGACVIAQIDLDLGVLANRRLPAGQRAEALRFLIHFVGDIHQPLHAADNGDRGGNDIHLRWRGQDTSMHHLWDMQLVEASSRDPVTVARQIAASISPLQWRAWQSGTPASWANESLHLAQRDIYAMAGGRRQVRLGRGYAAREAPVARMQLARAGVRLAWLLNRVLK